MKKPTRRPPHREGDSGTVPDAQGTLILKGGRNDRTVPPRIFTRRGERVKRCSFSLGDGRFSGISPYEEREKATAYAEGARKVATAIHEHLGPDAAAFVLNRSTAAMRWKAREARKAAKYEHVRPQDIAIRLAPKTGPGQDHDGDTD